jgi:hypothetical protein
MVDSKVSPANNGGHQTFKEAVCIDVARVYDSCSDKDCLEDLRVYFCDAEQKIVNRAVTIKGRSAELVRAYLDVEPVQFNRGFYSVDITFIFKVAVEVYDTPTGRAHCKPEIVSGIASFSKKVILYGSEGNIKIFSSDFEAGEDDEQNSPSNNLPKAVLEAVDPIFLAAKIVDRDCTCDPDDGELPDIFARNLDGTVGGVVPTKIVLVTLGLFSIVKIERQVQLLIPAYDFCVPDKECTNSTGDPCELFKSIKFPASEFFPPRFCEQEADEARPVDCGCEGGRERNSDRDRR